MAIEDIVKTAKGPGLVVTGSFGTTVDGVLEEISRLLHRVYEKENHTFVYRGRAEKSRSPNTYYGEVFDPSKLSASEGIIPSSDGFRTGTIVENTRPIANVRLIAEEVAGKPSYSGTDYPETAAIPIKPRVVVFFNPTRESRLGSAIQHRNYFFDNYRR